MFFNEVIDLKNDIKTYSSKDVAKRLSIEPVTVRKYSQMLEDEGYSFNKALYCENKKEHIFSVHLKKPPSSHFFRLFRRNFSCQKF
ncbi:hypothetical protein [Niallia sp. 03133]|uniref:hypothetical protein n=1 Tax=Niallia sp. 03133 TaxID=3458060 RepID=UPI0040445C9B